jgi:hypothetical protein
METRNMILAIDMSRLEWLKTVREEFRVSHAAASERYRDAGAARTRAREALDEARSKYGARPDEISAAQEKLSAAELRFRELGADVEITRDKWSAASAVVGNCEAYIKRANKR